MQQLSINNHKSYTVFGLGHCCLDNICVLDPYPAKGKKGDVIRSLNVCGGPVPTALATLSKFGISTGFCGTIGDDPEGKTVLNNLSEFNVDVSRVVVDSNIRTAKANIWIDPANGERTVALDRTRHSWLTSGRVDFDFIKSCKAFISDARATAPNIEALKIAKANSVITILDIGADRDRLIEILPLIDYAIVSQDLQETFLPGSSPAELAENLLGHGVATAIVTLGAEGALWRNALASGVESGFDVGAIDTTGAGDIFHGAFIYGLLEGWNLQKNILHANAAAALACTKLSGMGGIPSLNEVSTLLV